MEKKRQHEEVEDAVWWGEESCEWCSNRAYYKVGDSICCGTHSRNVKRTELPKNPRADEVKANKFELWKTLVDEAAKKNRAAKQSGVLTCAKMLMMKEPPHVDGVLNVFPNYRHQNRKDGFGCASLSPMSLGPVVHEQPGWPVAKTIENYHQFNKVFEREGTKLHNRTEAEISPAYYEMRKNAYLDPVPHRHKFADLKGKNKNIPVFSVHFTKKGEERRYTYIQSRYFYCHQYEILAKQQADFRTLKQMLLDGKNLQIVGYDAYPVTDTLWNHYNDDKRPFGHELVLYTLLKLEDPAEYPWNRFYRENTQLYE